jgi:DNA-binding CsgD family transcriptional regulator
VIKIKNIIVIVVVGVVVAVVNAHGRVVWGARFPSGCGKRAWVGGSGSAFSKVPVVDLWEGGGWGLGGPAFHRYSIGTVRHVRFHSPPQEGNTMGIPNPAKETISRLEEKTLNARFLNEIREGLGCSPFEAEAVLQVVKEVYFPFLDPSTSATMPGTIGLVAVCADEPAGKPIADCEKRSICLTLHRGTEDDRLLQKSPGAFRRARIPTLCQEALSQGALMTREDLAFRVFFVSPRTISRDLKALREEDPQAVIPLRSTVHDIGPMLTHRSDIVRLTLEGKTTTEISTIMRHTPEAIANYVSTFIRCAQLAQLDMQVGQIAFLLRRGKGLVKLYLELLEECNTDRNMAYHLDELLRLGCCGGKKNRRSGSNHG